ncbi:Uncharacterised protein [BD1-7 clade bacterium]|uniref:DUF1214 domain-containing protein n=1 Tax=BD1-7 clade bacterium TaxID=2029982 RepID=A0A5S9PJK4_9GAMM|nr:Uncharacterised protein [BD1-7 clade bacterium]CAA0103909.1 Uncharacterised protein [BD1-7 clade bacterium]
MSQTENKPRDALMSGESWDAFCDGLKEAGHAVIMHPDAPNNALDRAEGFRYLTRLTRAALESFVEASDAHAPVFRQPVHETIKMGMDNPDNIYLAAPVNGKFDYRIRGKRNTVHYLGFGAQAGGYGKTGSLDTDGYLDAADMQIDADGNFEVIASATPQEAGNWLPMSSATRLIQVRQTRLDHGAEIPADVTIERINADNRPRDFDPDRMDNALRSAAFFVHATADLFRQWTEDFRKHPNQLPRFSPEKALQAGGDPNIAYYHSYFDLADGEALLIELEPPECDFWNFQLGNYWLESLDYRFYPVHLNKHTARVNDNGKIQIVLAAEDPGLDNWMDTRGRQQGTMCVRWIRAETHPTPVCKRVMLSELVG